MIENYNAIRNQAACSIKTKVKTLVVFLQEIIHPEKYWSQRLELMRKSVEHDRIQIKMLSIEPSKLAISENQDKNKNANIQDKIKFLEGILFENKRELEKAKSELTRITGRKDKP